MVDENTLSSVNTSSLSRKEQLERWKAKKRAKAAEARGKMSSIQSRNSWSSKNSHQSLASSQHSQSSHRSSSVLRPPSPFIASNRLSKSSCERSASSGSRSAVDRNASSRRSFYLPPTSSEPRRPLSQRSHNYLAPTETSAARYRSLPPRQSQDFRPICTSSPNIAIVECRRNTVVMSPLESPYTESGAEYRENETPLAYKEENTSGSMKEVGDTVEDASTHCQSPSKPGRDSLLSLSFITAPQELSEMIDPVATQPQSSDLLSPIIQSSSADECTSLESLAAYESPPVNDAPSVEMIVPTKGTGSPGELSLERSYLEPSNGSENGSLQSLRDDKSVLCLSTTNSHSQEVHSIADSTVLVESPSTDNEPVCFIATPLTLTDDRSESSETRTSLNSASPARTHRLSRHRRSSSRRIDASYLILPIPSLRLDTQMNASPSIREGAPGTTPLSNSSTTSQGSFGWRSELSPELPDFNRRARLDRRQPILPIPSLRNDIQGQEHLVTSGKMALLSVNTSPEHQNGWVGPREFASIDHRTVLTQIPEDVVVVDEEEEEEECSALVHSNSHEQLQKQVKQLSLDNAKLEAQLRIARDTQLKDSTLGYTELFLKIRTLKSEIARHKTDKEEMTKTNKQMEQLAVDGVARAMEQANELRNENATLKLSLKQMQEKLETLQRSQSNSEH